MESREPNLQQLAYFGAREKIKSLVEQKHQIDRDITELKKFLRAGKHTLVETVKRKYTKRKKQLSVKQLKAMKANAAKAREARAKNLALLVKK
jgi:hypothetical protein